MSVQVERWRELEGETETMVRRGLDYNTATSNNMFHPGPRPSGNVQRLDYPGYPGLGYTVPDGIEGAGRTRQPALRLPKVGTPGYRLAA